MHPTFRYSTKIRYPLSNLDKRDISTIYQQEELSELFNLTWSCSEIATDDDWEADKRHCSVCYQCQERIYGFGRVYWRTYGLLQRGHFLTNVKTEVIMSRTYRKRFQKFENYYGCTTFHRAPLIEQWDENEKSRNRAIYYSETSKWYTGNLPLS